MTKKNVNTLSSRQMKLMSVVLVVAFVCLLQQVMRISSIPLNKLSLQAPEVVSFLSVGIMFLTVFFLFSKSLIDVRRTLKLAYIDELTELPNKRAFERQLEAALTQSPAGQPLPTIMYFDLDKFKSINDGYGHDAGDVVLREFGGRLTRALGEDVMLARLAGDEFVAMLFQEDGNTCAREISKQVFSNLVEPIIYESRKIHIGVSIGAYCANEQDTDHVNVLRLADYALMQAKKNGRNTFCQFDPSMAEDLEIRGQLESDLREALQRDALSINYQPLISRENNSVKGVEALVRWVHPKFGIVSPDTFVRIAEEIGLIDRLGKAVLMKACFEIVKIPNMNLSVNISPLHFVQKGFIDTVEDTLRKSGLDPSRLEIEITEGVFISDPTRTKEVILELQRLGVQIALDDFGTGYSSMSYLRTMPVNRIKIDRTFLMDSENSECAKSMVSTMIQLGRSLGLGVTVEGVESENQLDFLKNSDCTEMQGYLFSKPMTLNELRNSVQSDVHRQQSAA